MADVTAVTVTYNGLPWIEQCLESLARASRRSLVDHGSTDGTLELVRERFPEVRVLEQENRGLGAGLNAGMRAAPARYHLLINSDAWLGGDALERLVAFADAHPDAAVVAPRLRNPDGTLQRSVRGFPTLWRLATEYFFLRKLAPALARAERVLRRRLRPRLGPCRRVGHGLVLPRPPGAADQVGMFDEDFFLFSEETDWLYRFHQAGWTVWFTPDAEAVHVGGASHGGRMYVENVRGLVRWFAKHRGAREAARARAAARGRAPAARPGLPRRARPDVPRRRPRALIRRIPWELLALPALGSPALLPDTGVGLWARLFAATACLLLPGALLARALRVPRFSAALAWALGAIFAAMAVVFLVHASLGARPDPARARSPPDPALDRGRAK